MLRQVNIFIFMGILALLASAASAAGVYKWIDAQGNVHYGQDRPKDAQAQELRIKTAPVGSSRKTAATAEATTDPADGQPPKDPAEKQREEVHSKNCEIARANLKVLQEGGLRLVTSNPDGSTKHWAEDERQAKIAEARKQMDYFCNAKKN